MEPNEKFLISDDPADVEACLATAPDYDGEQGCNGELPEEDGVAGLLRGLRASFSAYPRRPGNLGRYGSAGSRGWGVGWPNCQAHRMSAIRGGGVRIAVRNEIAPIVRELLNYAENKLGYEIKSGQTGGFNCRPIGGTSTASNHSWGLAVDVNWQSNPMSRRFVSDLPPKLVTAFWQCGFYWGGWYNGGTYDSMHFEYTGRPGDAERHLRIAQALNAPAVVAPAPATTAAAPKLTVSVSKLKAAYNAEGRGEPDPDTKQLQARLNALGFKCGTPDGYYGQATREAMTAYRSKKYGTYFGHPDTLGAPGRQSLADLGFKVTD